MFTELYGEGADLGDDALPEIETEEKKDAY